MTKFSDSHMVMTAEPSPERSCVAPIILAIFFSLFGILVVIVAISVFIVNKKKKQLTE